MTRATIVRKINVYDPGVLPTWAAGVSVMQWSTIPNSALSSVAPSPTPAGFVGPASKITAWCGAAYSRLRRAYIIAAAGGHGDYSGNEVNIINLGSNTPAWSVARASSADADMCNGTVYNDGRRASTHSYWSTQYVEAIDRTFIAQCYGLDYTPFSGRSVTYPLKREIMAFNHATGDWDPPAQWALWPNTGVDAWYGALGASNVLTGEIYAASQFDGQQLRRFNHTTNSWSVVMSLDNAAFGGAAIDPVRNRMLQVGAGSALGGRVINLTTGQYISVTFGGLGNAALTLPGEYLGMVFDELNDCFYVFPSGSASQMLRVRASDWFVDAPTTTGTPPGGRTNGWQNSWQYDPTLKGIFCAHDYNGNMAYLRTSA